MAAYRYLIVGGGMTGDAACRGIRDHDADGSIGMFGAESHEPYARPPLSKGLWSGKEEGSIFRGTPELGVDIHTGRRIVVARSRRSDRDRRRGRGALVREGAARDRWHAAAAAVERRTTSSTTARSTTTGGCAALAGDGVRVAVIGGGFIGSEIAAALATNGCDGDHRLPGRRDRRAPLPRGALGLRERLLPREGRHRSRRGARRERSAPASVTTKSGTTIEADAIVAGLGIVPATDLAEAAGLEVDDGILVDEYGRAGGRDDVFAAGDVARFPVPALGGTRRVEHEDHANTHGRAVGANMAGAGTPYDHLPFFYSDLFDLGYEAVGDVDSRLDTVAEWAEPNRKGVVAYVDGDGKARGFLLWDVWGKVDSARELIRAGTVVGAADLRPLLD